MDYEPNQAKPEQEEDQFNNQAEQNNMSQSQYMPHSNQQPDYYGKQQYQGQTRAESYTQYNPYNQQQYNPPQSSYQSPVNQTQSGQQTTNQQVQKQVVKNPQSNIVPDVKTPEMNDRDYLNDILTTEKYLTDNYNVFVRESSNNQLYKEIKQVLMETHDNERNIFNLMFKNGFYSMKVANSQEIQQTQQKFNQYLSCQDPFNPQNNNTQNTGYNPGQQW